MQRRLLKALLLLVLFVEWMNNASDHCQCKPWEHTASGLAFLGFQVFSCRKFLDITKRVKLSNQTYKNHIFHTGSNFTKSSKDTGNFWVASEACNSTVVQTQLCRPLTAAGGTLTRVTPKNSPRGALRAALTQREICELWNMVIYYLVTGWL